MTSKAWPHRDRGPDDPCRRQLGTSVLHLTLYQPHFDPLGEYCEEVPRPGKTIVVVDVSPGELRQVPMSLEVLTASDAGMPRVVLSLPPTVYRRGVMDAEVTLQAGSDYVARVIVGQDPPSAPQSLVFPVRVAAWYKALLTPALLIAALLVLTAVSVLRYCVSARQVESLAE